MQCPKCKHPELEDGLLFSMAVKWCPSCSGIWIPAGEYAAWQATMRRQPVEPAPNGTLGMKIVQSPFDTKAAQCPEDGHYLSRARVSQSIPFYVERCMCCGGMWSDGGEWEVLQALGLHTIIDQMFSANWQTKMREQELSERERQVIIDKLGQDLAQYIFQLAEVLEEHPHGDCAATYLLRRFEAKRKGVQQK